MPIAHTLGFPPLGAGRELKRATEGYWSGTVSREDLLRTGAELRARHWRLQQATGIDLIPSNDFSYYDRVMDACALFGAVPKRYGWVGGPVDLDTYFAMARGMQKGGRDVTAMEMTKCIDTKPVLVGPVTFLLLGKIRTARFDRLALLDALLPVYAEALSRLAAAGATWVQVDEPCLALDRTPAEREAFVRAYRFLADRVPNVKILVATYFAGLDDNLPTALQLPVAGLHVDTVRAATQLDALLEAWPSGGGREGKVLSLGVIDGRNIWKADLPAALRQVEDGLERAGAAQLWVAPSCSLLHVPIDLDLETKLDTELKGWLAFAKQKLGEVVILARALRDGRNSVLGRRRSVTCDAHRRSPRGARCNSGSRSSRRRRSAPSPKPRTCARRGRSFTTGSSRLRSTTRSSPTRSRTRSSCRRSWGWTCWCTGSSSATIWSSISASSSTASRSRSTAGCNPTGHGMSSRRSSTATCRAPSR